MTPAERFVLRVPVDASRVPDFNPDRRIRAVARSGESLQECLVDFNALGKGIASFQFDRLPERLCVTLGPETATAADLKRLQTISVMVPPSCWSEGKEVLLPVVKISAYYWWWWQHWRQTFSVTGRVLNTRGFPVPRATVHAFDVDAWWWWTAQEEVGCATTDADGCFEIPFTRCSGWWPWWWWSTRDWRVDPVLAKQITSFVRQYPRLAELKPAKEGPNLDVFRPLLALSSRRIPPAVPAKLSEAGKQGFEPTALDELRERLIEILPRNFPLPVWPWSAWSPWEDSGANLLFKVAETRNSQTTILLEETLRNVRWEIPSSLQVSLSIREQRPHLAAKGWSLVDHFFPGDCAPLAGASLRNRRDAMPRLRTPGLDGGTPNS